MGDDQDTAAATPDPVEVSDAGFRDKVAGAVKAAGREVLEKAFVLYYALRAPGTPTWCRSVIVSALAYFILPLDAIPDLIPVVGYSDDLGALAAALLTVAAHVTPEIREQARSALARLLP